ncbi:MAG: hypothetical protein ACP5R4_14600, partial [Armatimonadota bacterium]
DDLQAMVARNLSVREREVYKAQVIVEQEAEEFMRWRRTLSVAPVLADLQRRFEDIRQAELAKTERRFSHLSERDRELLDLLTKGIVKRILKEPIRQLKDHAETPDGASYLRAVRHLFGLDGVDEGPEHRKPNKSSSGEPSNGVGFDGQADDGMRQGGVQA